MPIITNYFTEVETGHKDFVRSFVHLKQSGVLPSGRGVLKKFDDDSEIPEEEKESGEGRADFPSELNDAQDRHDRNPTKERDRSTNVKGQGAAK